MLGQNSELSPWLARHHPLGEGYRQACSVLGPEQGTEQGILPWYATQELQQKLITSKHKETPGNTQATATAHYTHSTLLKSSNRPMAATRRRQGHQIMHGMARPANLWPRSFSLNHQRCHRRHGHASAIQTRPNSQRETRSS